jgi:hypothetical protein
VPILDKDFCAVCSGWTLGQAKLCRLPDKKHSAKKKVHTKDGVSGHFLLLRRDAFSKVGLIPAAEMHGYPSECWLMGTPADLMDESFRVLENTVTDCLPEFLKRVRHIFGEDYLTRPNVNKARTISHHIHLSSKQMIVQSS